jgi:hypothetical protein
MLHTARNNFLLSTGAGYCDKIWIIKEKTWKYWTFSPDCGMLYAVNLGQWRIDPILNTEESA